RHDPQSGTTTPVSPCGAAPAVSGGRMEPMGSGVVGGRAWGFQQIRGKSRGNEYQPNNWKRKRTHGWIKRISTPGGIAVILRRMIKGRKSLSH
uniref:Large ribosomal subunit protein bL34m n=1 Tax=Malurus cyaneus samueli TaxID=2593467 RepID=A0A8C5TH61_9PASS